MGGRPQPGGAKAGRGCGLRDRSGRSGAGGAEGPISASWGIQNQPTIRFIYMYELPAQAYVDAVNDFSALQNAGRLRHLPVREFPLDQIARCHEAVEAGNSGTRMIVKLP